jgi:putative aminopeptidase FrvX
MVILALALFAAPAAAQSKAWDILREIVLVPGVSGHEGPVSYFIQGRLPAGLKAERDGMNNVWFTVGSGKPHLLFVAHTDELGWIVGGITPSGRVRVKPGGGILPQTVEARPVHIHSAKGVVPGIVSPRPGYDERQPPEDASDTPFTAEGFEIYLGVGTEAEARALGVAEGDPVTAKKTLTDFGPGLMATRAVDDRAGCAALLMALERIDPAKIPNRVTFAWDVEEETGLVGAAVLAERLRPAYVFAVDTFVSSDTPIDPRRYARIPLGSGAVLRAVDNSVITPPAFVERVKKLAAARGIPVTVGVTSGGNDGSQFTKNGAIVLPISWPGRYSHSAVEVIDGRDLQALVDLIVALVTDLQ